LERCMLCCVFVFVFFFSSRRRHTRFSRDWSSDVCSSDLIVGENGSEWVANAQAVKNPTVRPILDVLDTAQKNGTISTMNLQDIIAGTLGRRRVQGREVGGYVNRDATPPDSMQDQRIYEVLNR